MLMVVFLLLQDLLKGVRSTADIIKAREFWRPVLEALSTHGNYDHLFAAIIAGAPVDAAPVHCLTTRTLYRCISIQE